jgi:hypothetical protein
LTAQMLLSPETHGKPLVLKAPTGPMRRRLGQATVSRLRPLRRREARTLRPPRVAMRARNPIRRTRFLRCGRKVGCMM